MIALTESSSRLYALEYWRVLESQEKGDDTLDPNLTFSNNLNMAIIKKINDYSFFFSRRGCKGRTESVSLALTGFLHMNQPCPLEPCAVVNLVSFSFPPQG